MVDTYLDGEFFSNADIGGIREIMLSEDANFDVSRLTQDVDQLREKRKADIAAAADAEQVKFIDSAGDVRRDVWTAQGILVTLRLMATDPAYVSTTLVPMIDAILQEQCDRRGELETPAELADKSLTRLLGLAQAGGRIEGHHRGVQKALDMALDESNIESVYAGGAQDLADDVAATHGEVESALRATQASQ